MLKNRPPKIYPFNLKVNCQKMSESQIYDLASKIVCIANSGGYLDTQIIGDDTIFIKGEASQEDYNKIWDALDAYNIILD